MSSINIDWGSFAAWAALLVALIPSAEGDFNNLVIFVDRMSGSSSIDLEGVEKLDLS